MWCTLISISPYILVFLSAALISYSCSMSTLANNIYYLTLPISEIAKRPQYSSSHSQRARFTHIQRHRYSTKLKAVLRMSQNPALREKFTIPNKYGEKLVGVLDDTGSKEIVVLCHGFRSSKDHGTMVTIAAALVSEGIGALRFDFAGNGESEGSFQYGNYRREAEDLRAVVEHFTASGREIKAIVGHSKGGNIVLLYASKYHDIFTVVNVSGRYHLERGIQERLGEGFLERIKIDEFIDVKNKAGEVDYRVTEEALNDRLNTNMYEACLQIDDKCRVLTVHGSADEIIATDDAIEFSKIIKNHKLHVIAGADHRYSLHKSELAAVIVPFIKEGLH